MSLLGFIRKEPAVITGLLSAGLGVGASLGLHLSAHQVTEVTGTVTALTGFIVRGKVTPAAPLDTRLASIERLLAGLAKETPAGVNLANTLAATFDPKIAPEVAKVGAEAASAAAEAEAEFQRQLAVVTAPPVVEPPTTS